MKNRKHPVVGILTAWGAEDWIEPAIKQGLNYCDELHICISAHSENLLQFEDNTFNIALKYQDKAKISTYDKRSFHTNVKSEIINAALQNSKYLEKGTWVFILDVDEFFKEETFEYLNKVIDIDFCDQICFEARFFYINTKHYLLSDHNRLFKIHDKNCRFYPTQKWVYATKLFRVPVDIGMYHYSMLQNPHMKMEFWKTEYSHKQNHKTQWLDKIYRNYDLNDEEAWLRRNKAFTGNAGPWISDAFIPDEDGKLFKYNGTHPRLIEEAGFTKIEDFRKYWGFI